MKLFVTAAIAVLASSISLAAPVCPPLNSNDCKLNAVAKLCRYDQDDYKIYDWAQKTEDTRSFFFSWIDDCKGNELTGLSTAVHETTHRMTAELQAYPLVNAEQFSFSSCEVASANMFEPKKIAPYFDKSDDFVQTYLLGDASSSGDFCYLLDELNAYGHDLNTAVHLKDHVVMPPNVTEDRRAGLLATMSFLKVYADSAQRTDPKSWSAMQGPLKNTIQALWKQANSIERTSCGLADWGGEYFYGVLCSKDRMNAIYSLTQEYPAICLSPAACTPK